jgi:hypothetical protein
MVLVTDLIRCSRQINDASREGEHQGVAEAQLQQR